MMFKLRRLIRLVNKYVDLVFLNQEKARKNAKQYLVEAKIVLEVLIDQGEDLNVQFLDLCNKSSSIWNTDQQNIFSSAKKAFLMAFLNHLLYKLSGYLGIINILQKNMKAVITRLSQFDKILHR